MNTTLRPRNAFRDAIFTTWRNVLANLLETLPSSITKRILKWSSRIVEVLTTEMFFAVYGRLGDFFSSWSWICVLFVDVFSQYFTKIYLIFFFSYSSFYILHLQTPHTKWLQSTSPKWKYSRYFPDPRILSSTVCIYACLLSLSSGTSTTPLHNLHAKVQDTIPRRSYHRRGSHVESLNYVAKFNGQYCLLTYASMWVCADFERCLLVKCVIMVTWWQMGGLLIPPSYTRKHIPHSKHRDRLFPSIAWRNQQPSSSLSNNQHTY